MRIFDNFLIVAVINIVCWYTVWFFVSFDLCCCCCCDSFITLKSDDVGKFELYGWIIKVCRVCSILFSSIFLSLDLALQYSEKMVNFIPLVHFSNENNVYRCINKVFFCLVSREMSKISARLEAKILIYKAFSYFLIWHRYHTLFLLRDLLFAPVCPFV